MPKIPGVNHQDAVRALEKSGFRIIRQGKHIVMTDGVRILTIPRHNPVNAYTMGGIVRDAGLTVEEFKKLLWSHEIAFEVRFSVVVSRRVLALILLCVLPLAGASRVSAQEDDARVEERVLGAPLSVLGDKRRAALIVNRSLSVDTRGRVRGIINEIFYDQPRTLPRHEYAYELVSKRFEKYVNDYRSLVLVEDLEEADFVIVYKVVREVRSFSPDQPFIYGEMFVFLNKSQDEPEPALLWRTKDDQTSPEDATKEFIKQLKNLRGER